VGTIFKNIKQSKTTGFGAKSVVSEAGLPVHRVPARSVIVLILAEKFG